jgi:hypothetical protein
MMPTHRWKLIVAIIAVASAVLLAVLLLRKPPDAQVGEKIPTLATDEIVIVRTKGGKLQVSTLIKNEEFGWQTSWTCPFIDCGKLLGKTVSEVRVPVHYTFAIPLTREWSLKFRGEYFELRVPKEEANIPPAIELDKLQMRTTKGWMSPDVAANQVSLMKHLGPELAEKAKRADYVSAQRDEARKTVAEFARKWMVEQSAGKGKADYPIKVIFEGEVNRPAENHSTCGFSAKSYA